MRPGFFRSLYFSLKSPEDTRLLRFLLALPRSEQNRILKAALQGALPRYLKRHHPDIIPLPPAAVPAAVDQARRPRRRPHTARPRRADDATGPPLLTAPSGDDGHRPPIEEPIVASSQASEAERCQEAERRLDRLLRSLTK